MAANDTDTADAIGRAYAAGLLGHEQPDFGPSSKDLLQAGRNIAWQYWRVYASQFPTPDSLARFQPCQPSARIDPDRERIIEAALNDALKIVEGESRDCRRAFDQLVIDLNPDYGPKWLDNIIYAHRRKQRATEGDYNMLRLAKKGLELIA